MMKKFQGKVKWIASVGLLIVAFFCMALVGERVVAALFNLWKFSGYPDWQGIDLGTESIFLFLIGCLYGLAASFALFIFCKPQAGTLLSRILITAGGLYFINGSLLLLMVSSGIGYLYCGR